MDFAPTAADYANHNANAALTQTKKLEARIEALEQRVEIQSRSLELVTSIIERIVGYIGSTIDES